MRFIQGKTIDLAVPLRPNIDLGPLPEKSRERYERGEQ